MTAAVMTKTPLVGRIVARQAFPVASRNLSTRKSLAAVAALESRALSSFLPPPALAPLYQSSPSSLLFRGSNPTNNNSRSGPLFSPARSFASDASAIQPDIKLYQYHICPFCNITKALLSYSNLNYEAVEVNPLTKAELKPWSGDYKKVPIALMDEKQINGSEEILASVLDSSHVQSVLEKQWKDMNDDDKDNMTMEQFRKSENAQKWMRYAVDDLAALLYPNICGSLGDSYDAFGYVKNVDAFSTLQKMSIQSLGAVAMYFAASKVKSKRGITDEKAALREALDKFETDGLQNGKLTYSSGMACPDMGDVAVFGVLYSVRGLNAHDEAIESRGGPVKEWYHRMHKQVIGEK